MFIIWGDPEAFKRAHEAEMMLRLRSKHDPGRPPRRKRGDKFILIGAILGVFIGGAAGAIVFSHYFGSAGLVVGLVGGVIVGGTIGATVGDLIKKRRGKQKKVEPGPLK